MVLERALIIKKVWLDKIFYEGKHIILIASNGWYYGNNRKTYISIPIKTLSDLAEETKGQLKLKNFEL